MEELFKNTNIERKAEYLDAYDKNWYYLNEQFLKNRLYDF